ncbi:MAG: sugar transporter ATP-binding protein [Massilia sp.]|nr:sugar transporter ATP-binding protein [Massilia sp.]
MASVQLRGITKSYEAGQRVIHAIDLDIPDGQFVVFVGPSGCGKSTLLRMIAGVEAITEGELSIGGRPCNDVAPAERGIAMVFQSYALYPHMTVAQNMGFALKLARVPTAEVNQRVAAAARILQIEPLLDRTPKALSGGQRQRVAIGRAIVRKPAVFLFDEPLSNLDAALRVQMRIELAHLHQQLKTTMIYVTHDQVEAMTMGDQIVVFNGGRIEQAGTPLELYRRPANRFVAGFLGSPRMNFIDGRIVGSQAGPAGLNLQLPGGEVVSVAACAPAAAVGQAATLGVRPEHIVLETAPTAGANSVPGTVALVEHLGDAMIVHVRLAGVAQALAVKAGADGPRPRHGAVVHLLLDGARAFCFDADGKTFAAAVAAEAAG